MANPDASTEPASASLLEAPRCASARGYLRHGLPPVYPDGLRRLNDNGTSPGAALEEGNLAMRFLGALEEVLDPVVALLDCLSAHFDPETAPDDLVRLMSGWLGLPVEEDLSPTDQRLMLRQAGDLLRRRGTKSGIERVLELCFPELKFEVNDEERVRWARDPRRQTPAPPFVVSCRSPALEEQRPAVARLIEAMRPAHVSYELEGPEPRASEGRST